MAGGNLDARIAVERTENELEQVAQALNGAFDRLHRALDSQQRFTADASHELRTPLATICRRDRVGAVAAAFGGRIPRVARHLPARHGPHGAPGRAAADARARGSRDDRSRSRAGGARADRPAKPSRSCSRSRCGEGITIETRLDTARVNGDRDCLTELVTNLCSNAVEYNRDGGHVTVEVWPDGPDACMRVRDSGVGISEDDLPRIFERFYRTDKVRDRRTGGAGLGLAIAKWIVDAHGGRITCRSTARRRDRNAGPPAAAGLRTRTQRY